MLARVHEAQLFPDWIVSAFIFAFEWKRYVLPAPLGLVGEYEELCIRHAHFHDLHRINEVFRSAEIEGVAESVVQIVPAADRDADGFTLGYLPVQLRVFCARGLPGRELLLEYRLDDVEVPAAFKASVCAKREESHIPRIAEAHVTVSRDTDAEQRPYPAEGPLPFVFIEEIIFRPSPEKLREKAPDPRRGKFKRDGEENALRQMEPPSPERGLAVIGRDFLVVRIEDIQKLAV